MLSDPHNQIPLEKNHIVCENPLLLEIKQFYKKEFALSRKAAQIIHNHMDIWISEEEMGFITLHIVNASMKQRSDILINSIQTSGKRGASDRKSYIQPCGYPAYDSVGCKRRDFKSE